MMRERFAAAKGRTCSGDKRLPVLHFRADRPWDPPASRTMGTGGKAARAWRRGSDWVEPTPSLCLRGKIYGEFYLCFS